jgi:hypothetical protein
VRQLVDYLLPHPAHFFLVLETAFHLLFTQSSQHTLQFTPQVHIFSAFLSQSFAVCLVLTFIRYASDWWVYWNGRWRDGTPRSTPRRTTSPPATRPSTRLFSRHEFPVNLV